MLQPRDSCSPEKAFPFGKGIADLSATPQATCSMWFSSALDYSSPRFSQAIQPLVRSMQDSFLHTPAPQRCRESSSAWLTGGRRGPALSRVKRGDADVVLP